MKIILADDHKIFREGIAQLIIRQLQNVTVVEANNGVEVLEVIKNEPADVVLLDINMPELDGIETAKKLKLDYPQVKIIMLTMHDSHKYIKALIEIGVHGYLLKTTSSKELMKSIETVLAGDTFYGKNVQDSFFENFSIDKIEQAIRLTKREQDTLRLICEELNTNEIAEKLFISTHTVETHRKNLLSKTGAKNVAGLVKFAINNKLVEI